MPCLLLRQETASLAIAAQAVTRAAVAAIGIAIAYQVSMLSQPFADWCTALGGP